MTHINSIGHSNHTWDVFVRLLKTNGIQLVVDVRTNPVSGRTAFANKVTLPTLLERESIRYVFMGDSLGGKPKDPSMYDEKGKPDYRKMRTTESFREGIDQLAVLAEGTSLAIMCSEEAPGKCHRLLLLGPALVERGVVMHHIRRDGSMQAGFRLDGALDSVSGQV